MESIETNEPPNIPLNFGPTGKSLKNEFFIFKRMIQNSEVK